MSVTGHKSIQSLTIYQKVCEDDKLSMGISLTYSLLHPNEVSKLQAIINKEQRALENNSRQPVQNDDQLTLPAPPKPTAPISSQHIVENHALDPANNNILP